MAVYWSASRSLTVASPRTSSTKPNPSRRSFVIVFNASRVFSPAMNWRPISSILLRIILPSTALPSLPVLPASLVPVRRKEGSSRSSSPKYSRMCRARLSLLFRVGKTSTKRNICVLNASFDMHQSSTEPTHRFLSNSDGFSPAMLR